MAEEHEEIKPQGHSGGMTDRTVEPGDAADQAQWLIEQQERESIQAALRADPRVTDRLVEEEHPGIYGGGDLDVDEVRHPFDEPPLVADPESDSSDDPFHAGGENPGFERRGPSGMHIERP